jgi:hypothetical protein
MISTETNDERQMMSQDTIMCENDIVTSSSRTILEKVNRFTAERGGWLPLVMVVSCKTDDGVHNRGAQ